MTLPSPGSYEEFDSLASPAEAMNPLGTGLPAAWWPSVGGITSLIFSVLWMSESWDKSGPHWGGVRERPARGDVVTVTGRVAATKPIELQILAMR